ncbi:hypothetical protein F9C28_09400 [Shimwellia pseudoproteus]|nr:hypothetical protein [Shimwellia pseudoproteus]
MTKKTPFWVFFCASRHKLSPRSIACWLKLWYLTCIILMREINRSHITTAESIYRFGGQQRLAA